MMDFLSLNVHADKRIMTAGFENNLLVDCVLRWVFRFQERWMSYEEVVCLAVDDAGVGCVCSGPWSGGSVA